MTPFEARVQALAFADKVREAGQCRQDGVLDIAAWYLEFLLDGKVEPYPLNKPKE